MKNIGTLFCSVGSPDEVAQEICDDPGSFSAKILIIMFKTLKNRNTS